MKIWYFTSIFQWNLWFVQKVEATYDKPSASNTVSVDTNHDIMSLSPEDNVHWHTTTPAQELPEEHDKELKLSTSLQKLFLVNPFGTRSVLMSYRSSVVAVGLQCTMCILLRGPQPYGRSVAQIQRVGQSRPSNFYPHECFDPSLSTRTVPWLEIINVIHFNR